MCIRLRDLFVPSAFSALKGLRSPRAKRRRRLQDRLGGQGGRAVLLLVPPAQDVVAVDAVGGEDQGEEEPYFSILVGNGSSRPMNAQ